MRRCFVLFLVVIASIFLRAQEKDEVALTHKPISTYLELLVEGAPTSGYVGPGFVTRPGVELWTRSLNINLETALSTLDKGVERSGTAYKVNANGYYNFATHFLIGGGYTWGKLVTSSWNKQSGHPYLSGGLLCKAYACQGIRFTYDYLFQGTDDSNGVRGGRVHLMVPIYKQRIFAVGGLAAYSVFESGCPTCQRSGVAAGEVGLRYQR